MSSTGKASEHRAVGGRRHDSGNYSGDTPKQSGSGPSMESSPAAGNAVAVSTGATNQISGEAYTFTSADSQSNTQHLAQLMAQLANDSTPSAARYWGSSEFTSTQPMSAAGSVGGCQMSQWLQCDERDIAYAIGGFTGQQVVHDLRYITRNRNTMVAQHRDGINGHEEYGHGRAGGRGGNGAHQPYDGRNDATKHGNDHAKGNSDEPNHSD